VTEPAASEPHPYGLDASLYADVAADEDTQDADATAMAVAAPADVDADAGPVATDQPFEQGGTASDDE
jgi:hypothetical protein